MKTIRSWQREIHQLAIDKGWWKSEPWTERNIPEVLCLIHSEISEALEELRHTNNPQDYAVADNGNVLGFGVELADAVIRILDLAEYFDIDLEHLIALKHEYNKGRAYRHGKNF
jgi:NTP pyrophosphatase (non-canonical NTP hydrolase)